MCLFNLAKNIVTTLNEKGHIAYFAGGWVRDYLLGIPSEDIDIATSATPEEIIKLFPKTILVGFSFGIVIVVDQTITFEVATFRTDLNYKDGRRPDKICFTDAKNDAERRDFTINGMFYDPIEEKVIDFVGGKEDLKNKCIRAIGDPNKRFEEDRLRMLRALRFKARFGFQIEKTTEIAIKEHAKDLFPSVSIERVVEEFKKAQKNNDLRSFLLDLHEYGLLSIIFPDLKIISLLELSTFLKSERKIPQGTPLMGHLIFLFPKYSLNELLGISKYLKLSKEESRFIEGFFKTKIFLDTPHDHFEWSEIYALDHIENYLKILSFDQKTPELFIAYHNDQIRKLEDSILRRKQNKWFVTGSELIHLGIDIGKEIKYWQIECEKLALNENLSKEEVFKKIKQRLNWPLRKS
jgi:poly(A) polymerase